MIKNDITYVISSNIWFYKDTLNVIISSLIDSGVSPNKILCVVSHAENDFEYEVMGVKCIGVEYGGLEFAGMIYLIENDLHLSDWYFILHDTCEVEKPFAEILENYEIPLGATHIAMYDKNWAMNLGMVSDKYIHDIKREFILEGKNKDKRYMINHEDQIFDNKGEWYFHSHNPHSSKFISQHVNEPPVDKYGNGTFRERYYWPHLHLSKWRTSANQGIGKNADGGVEHA